MSDLVGNPEDQFSQNEAHMMYSLTVSCESMQLKSYNINKSKQNLERDVKHFRHLFTLLTPSFGNHFLANYHVLKHPLTNLILSSFYIPKVFKSAAKITEIGSQIEI